MQRSLLLTGLFIDMQRKFITVIIIFIFAGFLWLQDNLSIKSNQNNDAQISTKTSTQVQNTPNNIQKNNHQDDSNLIATAFQNQKSNIQVQAQGKIIKLLPDDNKGSQHQKLIVQLNNSQTILIAHNIDLAPRIPDPKLNDLIEFYGEYEYSPQGGVIHWTHRDPKNKHTHGWLKYKGKTYQ